MKLSTCIGCDEHPVEVNKGGLCATCADEYTERCQRRREQPDARRAEILTAAVAISAERGYRDITRTDIANAAGCSVGLVSHHLGDMVDVRDAVMREAVRLHRVNVVAQGILRCDPIAMDAPLRLREAAKKHIIDTL